MLLLAARAIPAWHGSPHLRNGARLKQCSRRSSTTLRMTEGWQLPDGTFVSLEDEPRDAWLVWKGEILKWSHEGYGGERQPVSSVDAPVSLLTPTSMVATMRCGFVPGDVHASALTTPPVKSA